jgi:hypothetical protein
VDEDCTLALPAGTQSWKCAPWMVTLGMYCSVMHDVDVHVYAAPVDGLEAVD